MNQPPLPSTRLTLFWLFTAVLTYASALAVWRAQATAIFSAAILLLLALLLYLWQRWRELHRQHSRLRLLLYEVPRTIASQLETGEALTAAVDALENWGAWDDIAVLKVDEQTAVWQLSAASTPLKPIVGQTFAPTAGLITQAILSGEPQVAGAEAILPYSNPSFTYGSTLALPLKQEGAVVAVAIWHGRQPNLFSPSELWLVRALADHLLLALTHDQQRQTAVQHATHAQLWVQLPEAATLPHMLEQICTTFGYEAGQVSYLHPRHGRLLTVAERGLEPDEGGPLQEMWGAYLLHQHELVHVPDAWRETAAYDKLHIHLPELVPLLQAGSWRAMTGLPLHHGARLVGTLSLFHAHPRPLTAEEQAILTAAAHQVAIRMVQERLTAAHTETRHKLYALLQTSPDGLLFINQEEAVELINQPALALCGVDGTADWRGKPLAHLLRHEGLPPGLHQLLLAEQERLLVPPSAPQGDEMRVNGHTLYWRSVAVAPHGRLLLLRDVTQLRDAQHLRENLIHTTIHDLRNPLTTLRGAVEMLQEGQVTNSEPLYHVVNHSLGAMQELVDTILAVHQLENGQLELDYAPFELPDLVERVLARLRPTAEREQITLHQEVFAPLPVIWADERLIQRVLENLIDNALKFTPLGGRITILSTVVPQSAGEKVVVAVRDTGHGVPPALHDKIFERFMTAEKNGNGYGLGLAFCKMALAAHKQQIWVRSDEGQGSTFAFTLSAVKPS